MSIFRNIRAMLPRRPKTTDNFGRGDGRDEEEEDPSAADIDWSIPIDGMESRGTIGSGYEASRHLIYNILR